MADREFRFAYFTSAYEDTVAFYRDRLGMPVLHSWDRSEDDRGTLIDAGGGLIEVLARPRIEAEHLFDRRPPQGAFMVIEVERIDDMYNDVLRKGLPIEQELGNQSWGHRSFCLREPNGLVLYFFTDMLRVEA